MMTEEAVFAEKRGRGRPSNASKMMGEGLSDPSPIDAFGGPELPRRYTDADLQLDPKGLGPAYEAPMPMPSPADFQIPTGWLDLADAPDDGKAIWCLGPDGEETEVVWRNTRAFDKVGGKWRNIGFWSIRNTGGARLDFTPLAWRPI
jgi:hypothetical protein